MKKLALCGLLLAAWAHAQVSYDSLKAQIHSGTAPDAIRQAIIAEGLAFEVDIHVLRQMKADRMPDWLIDFLIEYNPSEWVSREDAPRRYDGHGVLDDDHEPRFYRWSRASYWGYAPWWSCVDWYLYRYNPWAYCFDGAWGYAGLGYWWPYYRSIYRIHYYEYERRRGRVTARGYRVADRRTVGRAYPRGTSPSRTGTVPARTRSTATRTSSIFSPRSARARTHTSTTATRSANTPSRSRSTATRSSSRSSSRATSSSSSRSRSSASRSSSSRSRSSASRSSSSRSRSSASRSSSGSRSSASRSRGSSRSARRK